MMGISATQTVPGMPVSKMVDSHTDIFLLSQVRGARSSYTQQQYSQTKIRREENQFRTHSLSLALIGLFNK